MKDARRLPRTDWKPNEHSQGPARELRITARVPQDTSFRERVDAFRKRKIEIGQAALVMGRED